MWTLQSQHMAYENCCELWDQVSLLLNLFLSRINYSHNQVTDISFSICWMQLRIALFLPQALIKSQICISALPLLLLPFGPFLHFSPFPWSLHDTQTCKYTFKSMVMQFRCFNISEGVILSSLMMKATHSSKIFKLLEIFVPTFLFSHFGLASQHSHELCCTYYFLCVLGSLLQQPTTLMALLAWKIPHSHVFVCLGYSYSSFKTHLIHQIVS